MHIAVAIPSMHAADVRAVRGLGLTDTYVQAQALEQMLRAYYDASTGHDAS